MDRKEAEEFGEGYWKPEHGRRVKFKNIDLVWLQNIREHIARRIDTASDQESAGWMVLCGLRGEAAIDTVESQLQYLGYGIAEGILFLAQLDRYIAYRQRCAPTMKTLGDHLRTKFAA